VEWWVEEAWSELLLALALTAKENAAIRIRMGLDPLDPAPSREKLLNGFLSRVCINLGRHNALPVDPSAIYVLPSPLVARGSLAFVLYSCRTIGCIAK
jgi:hypothetical protein